MKRESVAVIDEQRCIGCTLCIEACPVDAIVGANRFMHTVIEAQCIGCALCLPPCPVDCIAMAPLPAEKRVWTAADAHAARDRARRRKARIAAERAPRPLPDPETRRAVLAAAIARARVKRSANRP
jgi:electron transport complex protein RnfB